MSKLFAALLINNYFSVLHNYFDSPIKLSSDLSRIVLFV